MHFRTLASLLSGAIFDHARRNDSRCSLEAFRPVRAADVFATCSADFFLPFWNALTFALKTSDSQNGFALFRFQAARIFALVASECRYPSLRFPAASNF